MDIEKIIEKMCDNYCKYPAIYNSIHSDPDEANDRMLRDVCENCPLDHLRNNKENICVH